MAGSRGNDVTHLTSEEHDDDGLEPMSSPTYIRIRRDIQAPTVPGLLGFIVCRIKAVAAAVAIVVLELVSDLER